MCVKKNEVEIEHWMIFLFFGFATNIQIYFLYILSMRFEINIYSQQTNHTTTTVHKSKGSRISFILLLFSFHSFFLNLHRDCRRILLFFLVSLFYSVVLLNFIWRDIWTLKKKRTSFVWQSIVLPDNWNCVVTMDKSEGLIILMWLIEVRGNMAIEYGTMDNTIIFVAIFMIKTTWRICKYLNCQITRNSDPFLMTNG